MPLSRPVVECPCPYEVAACHAALPGGALNLIKLLLRDLGDHHLVTPYNGLFLPGFLIGSIFVFHITGVLEIVVKRYLKKGKVRACERLGQRPFGKLRERRGNTVRRR